MGFCCSTRIIIPSDLEAPIKRTSMDNPFQNDHVNTAESNIDKDQIPSPQFSPTKKPL